LIVDFTLLRIQCQRAVKPPSPPLSFFPLHHPTTTKAGFELNLTSLVHETFKSAIEEATSSEQSNDENAVAILTSTQAKLEAKMGEAVSCEI